MWLGADSIVWSSTVHHALPHQTGMMPSATQVHGNGERVISRHSQYLFDHVIKLKQSFSVDCSLVFALTFVHTYASSLRLSASLSISLSYAIFIPSYPLHLFSLDSISSGNDGVIQLSLALCLDQSASVFHVWLCVCVLRLARVLQMLRQQHCWSMFFMKYRSHLELMNKLMEACVAAAGEYLPFFPV